MLLTESPLPFQEASLRSLEESRLSVNYHSDSYAAFQTLQDSSWCAANSNKGLPQKSTHLLCDKPCVLGAQLKGATWESICTSEK